MTPALPSAAPQPTPCDPRPLAQPYWLHALTPLRVGVGEGLGAVNRPTLREVHTGHPLVPGSSVKGVLRAQLADTAAVRRLFGPEREQAGDHRGSLALTDAALFALPVRTLVGTFAWCCSPHTLRRLRRDRERSDLPLPLPDSLLREPVGARVCTGSRLLYTVEKSRTMLFVEEFPVDATEDTALDALAQATSEELWLKDPEARRFFVQGLVLLPSEVLDGLTRVALEVRARVCLDPDTGTAAGSGPWLEEALPAETLLCGLVSARATTVFQRSDGGQGGRQHERRVRPAEALDELHRRLAGAVLGVGGHTALGLGRVAWTQVRGAPSLPGGA